MKALHNGSRVKVKVRVKDAEQTALSFRKRMLVNAVRSYSSCPHLFSYPICPRCLVPMTREYQRYCEHCGQALDWSKFHKAVIITVPSQRRAR